MQDACHHELSKYKLSSKTNFLGVNNNNMVDLNKLVYRLIIGTFSEYLDSNRIFE